MPTDSELLRQASPEDYRGETAQQLREFQAKQKKIAGLQQKLNEANDQIAELKAQMKTTNRALNTRGISGTVQTIMHEMGMGDAKKNGVAKRTAQMLTDVYQQTLDTIDKGDMNGAIQSFDEGIYKIAEYLIDNTTYSEKTGYKWTTATWSDAFAKSAEARREAIVL